MLLKLTFYFLNVQNTKAFKSQFQPQIQYKLLFSTQNFLSIPEPLNNLLFSYKRQQFSCSTKSQRKFRWFFGSFQHLPPGRASRISGGRATGSWRRETDAERDGTLGGRRSFAILPKLCASVCTVVMGCQEQTFAARALYTNTITLLLGRFLSVCSYYQPL